MELPQSQSPPLPETASREPAGIAFGDLEPLRVIGTGQFGLVRLVRHRITGEPFALKVRRRTDTQRELGSLRVTSPLSMRMNPALETPPFRHCPAWDRLQRYRTKDCTCCQCVFICPVSSAGERQSDARSAPRR